MNHKPKYFRCLKLPKLIVGVVGGLLYIDIAYSACSPVTQNHLEQKKPLDTIDRGKQGVKNFGNIMLKCGSQGLTDAGRGRGCAYDDYVVYGSTIYVCGRRDAFNNNAGDKVATPGWVTTHPGKARNKIQPTDFPKCKTSDLTGKSALQIGNYYMYAPVFSGSKNALHATKTTACYLPTSETCGKAFEFVGTKKENQDCSANLENADKCTKECVSGLKWKETITKCDDGYNLQGDQCIQNIKAGDACTDPAELDRIGATAAIYVEYQGQLNCGATRCKSNYYQLLNKNGREMGYCVPKKKCGTGKVMNIIDGTKTDNTCVCDTENGYIADPNDSSKCIKQTDSIADTTSASAAGTSEPKGGNTNGAGDSAGGASELPGGETTAGGSNAGAEQANPVVEQTVTLTTEQSSALAVVATAAGSTGIEKQQQAEEQVQYLVDANAALQQQVGGTDGLTQQQLKTFDSAVEVLESNGGDVSKLADDQKDALVAVAEKYGKSSQTDVVAETEAEGEGTVETGANDETDAEAEAELAYEEAKEKYNKAKENEQSFGNKLLGAVGMGATGIGGSMLMSGLAESASDDEAEIAMKAYLSTFTCKYGNASVTGGTKNVEIPGGNELIQMYADYVSLANDLKVRKEALGMQPGIESEPILDSATSGLYDDVSTGKTKGAYASLARALSDPDSEDAKIWAAQREESDEKKKTGAIVAGVGAIGSLLGNVAINKIDWKAKQKKVLRDLETSVANITPPKVKCPQEATGVYAPDCDCSAIGKIYNPNMNQCEAKDLSGVVDSVKSAAQDVVEAVVGTSTVVRDNAANLSADAMFEFGKSNLLPGAQTALDEFVSGLRQESLSGCTINVVGHTDTKGRDDYNQGLSLRRANSVAEYLQKADFKDVIKNVQTDGKGESDCNCGVASKDGVNYLRDDKNVCEGKSGDFKIPDNTAFAPCRRVEVSLACTARGAVDANAMGQVLGAVAGTN